MKVILSRKGFDSKYGRRPSPVLPNGKMLSIPIPIDDNEIGVKYSDLNLPEKHGIPNCSTYLELMESLYPNKSIYLIDNRIGLEASTSCHLDPDLCFKITDRMCEEKEWKPMFGQVNGAKTHLEEQKVNVNDLFLFYGTFMHTYVNNENAIKFTKNSTPFHAIWGYLQIGRVLCNDKIKALSCEHPHKQEKYLGSANNTIYEATPKLSFDKDREGAGVFPFHENRILTKPGKSVSKWVLHDFMKTTKISCHTSNDFFGYNKDRDYFQSAYIGQEFVFKDTKEVKTWITELFS